MAMMIGMKSRTWCSESRIWKMVLSLPFNIELQHGTVLRRSKSKFMKMPLNLTKANMTRNKIENWFFWDCFNSMLKEDSKERSLFYLHYFSFSSCQWNLLLRTMRKVMNSEYPKCRLALKRPSHSQLKAMQKPPKNDKERKTVPTICQWIVFPQTSQSSFVKFVVR